MPCLSRYDGWSFYVHQAVIGPTGDPECFGREQDAQGALRSPYMATADILSYPGYFVESAVDHPMDCLAVKLIERGLAYRQNRLRDG